MCVYVYSCSRARVVRTCVCVCSHVSYVCVCVVCVSRWAPFFFLFFFFAGDIIDNISQSGCMMYRLLAAQLQITTPHRIFNNSNSTRSRPFYDPNFCRKSEDTWPGWRKSYCDVNNNCIFLTSLFQRNPIFGLPRTAASC